jgi:hypothetical protein
LEIELGRNLKMVDRNRNFVSDGASLTHQIEGNAFHGPLEFEFRPSTRLDRGDFLRKIGKLTEQGKHAEAEAETDRFLRSRLISWDAVGADGSPLAISQEAIAKMEPMLFEEFMGTILGLTPAVAKQMEDDQKN